MLFLLLCIVSENSKWRPRWEEVRFVKCLIIKRQLCCLHDLTALNIHTVSYSGVVWPSNQDHQEICEMRQFDEESLTISNMITTFVIFLWSVFNSIISMVRNVWSVLRSENWFILKIYLNSLKIKCVNKWIINVYFKEIGMQIPFVFVINILDIFWLLWSSKMVTTKPIHQIRRKTHKRKGQVSCFKQK